MALGAGVRTGARCVPINKSGKDMLYYAAIFFVIALIAGVLGFSGIAAGVVEISKILFSVFLVLFLLTLAVGLIPRKRR